MKKFAVLVAVLVVLGGGAYVAFRQGWLARLGRGAAVGPANAGQPAATPSAGGGAAATGPATLPSSTGVPGGIGTAVPPEQLAAIPADLNLLSLDMGAHVENFSSQYNESTWAADRAIDGDPGKAWSSGRDATFPHEIVFSFLDHQTVLLSAVAINPHLDRYAKQTPKDVEVWVSTQSAKDGFVQVAKGTMRQESVPQRIEFAPVQARFLKLRLLSNYGGEYTSVAEVQAFEGRAPGYTSILQRIPGMAALLVAANTKPAAPDAVIPGAAAASCGPVVPTPRTELGPQSRNVLVIANNDNDYPPLNYRPDESRGRDQVDYSVYGRVKFTRVGTAETTLPLLAQNFDTVVLSQVCDIKTSLSDQFKRGLIGWVSLGHKLIIQDSDDCGSSHIPDYSFLPYKFASSNPGARGAAGDRLLFVEENMLGNGREGDPAFLDIDNWLASKNDNHNEIGDSNTITQYDPQWCGHLFGTNVLKKNGFMEAYAHYGKGLIIYDGFDNDQSSGVAYRQLVTRELAQPVNPDGLMCSAHLGDFVITTDQRLKQQLLTPARAYQYPLTLLSNQGYKGNIKLSLAVTPPDPTMTYRFEPDTIPLTEIAQATLTVQTTGQTPATAHALAVRGTDEANLSNALCLQLMERKTGAIQITSAIERPKKASKNLEIVLDVSGSMKLPLGKKTRWTTALDVLKDVVSAVPDDFNVGLRVYAHRQPARSKATCTDTELIVPIRKLDRGRIQSAVSRLQPRGETPLIYSILQAPEDLKGVGGGSVVVITDGEDTCKGDPVAAAAELKNSGVDVTLNIVGFTLKGKQVQEQLTTLAQSTGGQYYGAQSGQALARALWIATIDKIPYSILDASGKEVAKGDAGAPPEELPPGDYTVVIKAADQELRENVTVATGVDTTLKVVLKGDKFVVER
ncbi:MAG: hypothetical protein DMF86_15630 [Acidobacteria bacterium]|nr:MAG: hypothetical protein DMF86_15630 [Acidobacteriota bacterium]